MSELSERLRYPRAGWISIVLLGVMALALAWSVQGAGWLEQMDFLVPVALYAVLAGSLLGMLRGSIVLAIRKCFVPSASTPSSCSMIEPRSIPSNDPARTAYSATTGTRKSIC